MKATPDRAFAAATERLDASRAPDVARAAGLLRSGGLVAMPTETVYGLAANALDGDAVARIFEAKGRPAWDPLIVHVCDDVMMERFVREVSSAARGLMGAFWPGPLTLLLPRFATLPEAVTAGRDLVGVRMPAHPVALELIRTAGFPLAAPSANRFGHISPTTAEHVLADLDGRIDAVLDAGPCAIGVESTVFDPASSVLYRQGGVSVSAIEALLDRPVLVYEAEGRRKPESLPSPGVGIRHYAPRARMMLVSDEAELREIAGSQAWQVGVMLPVGWSLPRFSGAVFRWGDWGDTAELAQRLYSGLRELDGRGVEVIAVPLPDPGERALLGALRDRLLKAARVE